MFTSLLGLSHVASKMFASVSLTMFCCSVGFSSLIAAGNKSHTWDDIPSKSSVKLASVKSYTYVIYQYAITV